jgi:exodeoxyribonuclease-5
MELSSQQIDATRAVKHWWHKTTNQVFKLFGYAGTGKTSLAQHLANELDVKVMFSAYTGKAVNVLKQKGCPAAKTVHQLIYKPVEKGRSRLKKLEKELEEIYLALKSNHYSDDSILIDEKYLEVFNAIAKEKRDNSVLFSLSETSDLQFVDLLVLDEASMIDATVANDLLGYGVRILVLGDPAQLPPIRGSGYFTSNSEPDYLLTEIHRQALDNPILHLATLARSKKHIDFGQYGDSHVLKIQDVANTELFVNPKEFDIILTGKNVTRAAYNTRLRELHGRTSESPVKGDKLVCTKNNHPIGLTNGSIWYVDEVLGEEHDSYQMDVCSEEDSSNRLCVNVSKDILHKKDSVNWYEVKDLDQFEYGYSVTVHKAQGSQWDKVLLHDQSYVFRDNAEKHLYTGITRAAKKLIMLRAT